MVYDVAAVRRSFPALAKGAAHFDAPGGSLVPREVGEAVFATLTSAIANRGRLTSAERRAERVVHEARTAMGDLLGCDPRGVVFGRSMTALTYHLAGTLAATWGAGDEVVVSNLDHDANVRPWVQAAERVGVSVRWASFDPHTGELPVAAIGDLLTARTRLVAFTGASNLIGTRPDVEAIAAAAHRAGALVYLDGVHLTPHAAVDMAALGADFYACSPYKFLGPHCGVLAADPRLLESLHPAKLLPSAGDVPERFELGTLPYELLAGTTAAVDFLAGMVPGQAAGTDRRSRLRASLAAMAEHEGALHSRLETGLRAIEGVSLYGHAARRTPTTLFSVAGMPAAQLSGALAARQVNAPAGSFYAVEASRALGLGETGAVRAGLAAYSNDDDVARLLAAVALAVAGED
jgi:cysteine desulfurase family protein (TIGR01976 family)